MAPPGYAPAARFNAPERTSTELLMFNANVVVIVAGVTGESANVTSYFEIVNADVGQGEVTMFRSRSCMPVIKLPGGTLAICAAEYTACDVPLTAFPIPATLPIVPAVVSDPLGTNTILCAHALPVLQHATNATAHFVIAAFTHMVCKALGMIDSPVAPLLCGIGLVYRGPPLSTKKIFEGSGPRGSNLRDPERRQSP